MRLLASELELGLQWDLALFHLSSSQLPYFFFPFSPLPFLLRLFSLYPTSFWSFKLLFLLALWTAAFCIPDERLFPGTLHLTPSSARPRPPSSRQEVRHNATHL